MKLTPLIFAIILVSVCSKLTYLFSMIRHGAIYPKNSFYDGNQTIKFKGQVTPVGMRQQYNLGTYLKQNYITEQQLTTPTFNPKHVEFYSSTYQRTQVSSISLIYGLFPLEEGWTIPDEVPSDKLYPPYTPLFKNMLHSQLEEQQFALNKGFQALPVRPLDNILDNCPNYNSLVTIRYREIAEQVAALELKQSIQIAKMMVLFNLTNAQTNVAVMSDLYQTLESDRYLGRPLPEQYNENDEKNMNYIYEYYNTLVQGGRFARTMITPSLRMLRQKLESVVLNNTSKRFTSISCHSSNIWPLLTQLNLTSPECITQKFKGDPVTAINCVAPPHFSASLLFQLHEDDDKQKIVRIRYNGQYVYLCESRQTKCLYQNFISRIQRMEVNFETECKIPKQSIQAQIVIE